MKAAELDQLSKTGKQRAQNELKNIFFAADQDLDQLLNQSEFLDAVERFRLAKEEREEPDTIRTREQLVAYYNAAKKITPETDGVSMMDLALALSY